MSEIEVSIREIQATEGAGAQIMILGELEGERQFPIFIGFNEMDALDRALHRREAPRPLTHDLILNVIDGMNSELVRVVIDDLRDDTFFGKLVVKHPSGEEVLIDSRPSDAIVLAARRQVPIFVAEHVIESIGQPPHQDEFE
jgi:bifunctional DNase/RNase